MAAEVIKIELFYARCDECGHEFEWPRPVAQDLMSLWTVAGEQAVINSITDPVFADVGRLVKQIMREWLEASRLEVYPCFSGVIGRVGVAVERLRIARVRYDGIGLHKPPKRAVVIAGAIVVQTRAGVVTLS